MRRLLAVLFVALLAAPGTWWRTDLPDSALFPRNDGRWDLALQPLEITDRRAGETVVVGAWWLTSSYPAFGSYSALVPIGGGRFLAASDTGRVLDFGRPGAPASPPTMDFFAGRREYNKFLVDIEAMTRDPASGRIWTAYEGSNTIERFEADFSAPARIRPIAMRGWSGNTGPEAMTRLADGRFLVISEGREGWLGGASPALLFPADPVDGAEPVSFRFRAPDGFRPVDAALLPDGRVLVLVRRFNWLPPSFANRILVADPAQIAVGAEWRGRQIAAITAPLPSDNYEGLAVEPAAAGTVRLWLISDDNRNKFQRTLLLALQWDPRYKARGISARPADQP